MFLRIRFIAVLACIVLGIAPQFSWADSHYRLAKTYAEKNDVEKASTHFGLALKNATPKQIAVVASDYATFLSETGNLHRAELILRQALTQSPNNEELTRSLARCLVRQEKVIEGLRYFTKSGYSQAEAKEEIAAIYREQSNTDMLVAAEKRWGGIQTEPVLVAAAPRPAISAKVATPSTHSVSSAVVSNSPPAPARIAVPNHRAVSAPTVTETVAVTVPVLPPSKSEIFDTKIPIPVPRLAPLPVVASSPRPAAPLLPSARQTAAGLPKPAPMPMVALPAVEKRPVVLENPVKLAVAPQPVRSVEQPPKPVTTLRPRKHYVVNASSTADLDALFPVKPAVALIPTNREL